MEFFDTHFHFDGHSDSRCIGAEALENEVKYLVCVGGDYQSSLDGLSFARSVENSYFTVGVHPHCAGKESWDIDLFSKLIEDKKCVAVGEIGLDYFYENSAKDVQQKVFEEFCWLGKKRDTPIIIHCRDKNDCFDAYEDTYRILKAVKLKPGQFVVHCYTGNLFWLEKLLELGAYIGITGIVTFRKAENIRNIVPNIPTDKLLLETDAPYLSPEPYRSKPNSPKYLKFIAEEVARIKSMSLENLAKITTSNALDFYKIIKRSKTVI